MPLTAYKAQAARLAEQLASKHRVKLKHASVLELIANIHGYYDWNTLAGTVEAQAPSLDIKAGALRSVDQQKTLITKQINAGGGVAVFENEIPFTLYRHLAQEAYRKEGKNTTWCLRPFECSVSSSFNPLRGTAKEIANRLCLLLPEADNPGADYYRQKAFEGLEAILDALLQANTHVRLTDLMKILMAKGGAEALALITPDSEAKHKLQTFIDNNSNTRHAVLGGITGRLYQITQGSVGNILNSTNPSFDFDSMLANGESLHASMTAFEFDRAGPNADGILRMLLSDLNRAITNSEQKVPFLTLLDGVPFLGATIK